MTLTVAIMTVRVKLSLETSTPKRYDDAIINKEVYPMERYNITLDSPLGKKSGSMTLEYTENQVNGILSMLGHDNLFSGEQNGENQIFVHGSVRTLFGALPSEVALRFEGDEVTGTAKVSGQTMPVRGVKAAQS